MATGVDVQQDSAPPASTGQRTPKGKHARKDSGLAPAKGPKAAASPVNGPPSTSEKSGTEKQQKQSKKAASKGSRKGTGAAASGGSTGTKSTMLFGHLPEYKKISKAEVVRRLGTWDLHPSVLQLGLQFADGTIRGGNARALSMLKAFAKVGTCAP